MKKRVDVHEKLMFIMRVSILQIFIVIAGISLANAHTVAGQEILDKKITLQLKRSSLRHALSRIEHEADVKFLFRSQLVPTGDQVSLQVVQERLSVVLDRIFSDRKIQYEADGNRIILTREDLSRQSSSTPVDDTMATMADVLVTGLVVDEANQPVPGANVLIKGTATGTTTDAEGHFSLKVPDPDAVLVITFIGYSPQEIAVGNKTEINVALQPDVSSLSEVVVIGYGTQKKADVISSISSVDGKDLVMRSMPNFESSLQGMAAGVSVQSQSGAPGAPVRVLIRGTNSINLSTDPLYIIDGMPISHGSGGLGSSNQSPMSLINQNDIESIEILKDAAATSIYGSRGSNGVIIVTTKNGKKGEGNTSFYFTTGFSHLTRTPDDVGFANTKQWFSIMDKAYSNSKLEFPDDLNEYYKNVPLSTIPLASPKLTRQQAENIQTNWYDELFQVGTFQDYNVSSSKGTDQTSFFISGNYRKDQGVQTNNNLERFTVRTNLDFTPIKNLTIGSKLTFGYTKNNQRNSGITSISVDALPWFPVHELDNPNRYFNAYTQSNAVAVSDPNNVLNRVEQYRGLGGVSLQYQLPFVKGLSVRSELSGDIIQSNRVFWQAGTIRPDATNTKPQSAGNEEAITFTSINYNAYASFNRNISLHSFSVVGGAEATRSSQYTRVMAGTGLIGKYQELGTPTTISSLRAQREYERYLLGFFGRANYKFNERYLAGISARRDGSSVFTPQNRWGTFVAFSAGWIISEEKFMSFLAGRTFLKLRGSYGETGNQNIPPNLDVVQYNNQPVIYGSKDIQGVNGTVPVNLAANNLQWESTKSSDIGIDFGFFNNRLNGSVAYYHRLVDKMLLLAPLPLSTGVSSRVDLLAGQGSYDRESNSILGNFGDMVNSGYELELHSINTDRNGFRWTTDFNIGFNKNVIQSLTPSIDQTGNGYENSFGNTVSRKGDRRAVWYIADYAGVDPITGVPLIYALDTDRFSKDGSTVHLRNNGEDVKLPATISNIRANRFYQDGKSGDPKYQGGITNTFNYRNFDFSFMVVFSGGNYILDYDRQMATVVNPTHNILQEVYDQSWSKPGDIAKYPELRAQFTYIIDGKPNAGFSGANAFHNGVLYKGDFVRLRNVQLGYTVPKVAVDKLHMRGLRVYVSGSNLFTITDYPGFDPEGVGTAQVPGFVYYANAIPQLKTFTIGIDARF